MKSIATELNNIIFYKSGNAIQINVKQELPVTETVEKQSSQEKGSQDETAKKQSSLEAAEKQTNSNVVEAFKKQPSLETAEEKTNSNVVKASKIQSNEETPRNNQSDEEEFLEKEDIQSNERNFKVLRNSDFYHECFEELTASKSEVLPPLKDVPLVFISSDEDSDWTVNMRGKIFKVI